MSEKHLIILEGGPLDGKRLESNKFQGETIKVKYYPNRLKNNEKWPKGDSWQWDAQMAVKVPGLDMKEREATYKRSVKVVLDNWHDSAIRYYTFIKD